jgi:iron complex outermembrane receptor protein
MGDFSLFSGFYPGLFDKCSVKGLMKNTGLILCLLVFVSGTFAQDMAPDTVLFLDDVNIYSSRITKYAKGQAIQTPDSLVRSEYPAASLAELINGFTSAYIRNYGQGTLSTLSFRGTSANHNSLLWNGIRIAPPNIGYVDLSLVQQSFFKNISILHGGASPMFGSGSIGGGIHLENCPVFDKNDCDAEIAISGGSFRTVAMEMNTSVSRKNFYSRTAFSVFNSPNNFSYENLEGDNENLPHADIFKSGIIQDIAFLLPGRQYLMASCWFQYADRNIPPTLTQEESEAVQTDRSWRTMLLWKNYNENNNLEGKLAYFNEYINYDDPLADVYSTIRSQTISASFESTWELWKNSDLFAGTLYSFEYADLDYYNQPESQQNLALYASYRHAFPSADWQASINGRQEFLAGYQSPFLFSAGAEGRIWKYLSGRLNLSRNFRAPTLNERFWQPGGNPELEPEESWNEEAGIMAGREFSNSKLNLELTFFNSNVNNWILWLPGSSYWSVENAQEVWSRGVEITGEQSVNINMITLLFGESYTYSKSTNEKQLSYLDASYKKQLIYTPLHRLTVRTGAYYEGFNLTLKGNYTSEVYSTKDNLQSLPGYFILDMILSKTFMPDTRCPVTLQMNVNNILNKEYQVIPYRPMPGINGLLTVRVGVEGKRSLVVSR